MEPSEDLVRLVDHDKVERRCGPERCGAALAPGKLPADQIYPGCGKASLVVLRWDAE